MRRLETRSMKASQRKKNQLKVGLLGIFLIGLMLISTLGYAFSNKDSDSENYLEYNGVKFYNQNDYWMFEIDGETYATRYNPLEVENISLSGSFSLEDYEGNPVYYTELNSATYEIANNLFRFAQRSSFACLDENCEKDYAIKSCSDNLVIDVREGNQGVFSEEKCVYISANKSEQIKYADAYIFKVLGI